MKRVNTYIKRRLRLIEDRLGTLTGNKFEFKADVVGDGVVFESDDYFNMQDQGVKGIKSGTSKAGYKFKLPYDIPASAFSKYTNDKSAQFAIARSVENKGIKAKNYTDKFMKDERILDLIADIYAELIINDKI